MNMSVCLSVCLSVCMCVSLSLSVSVPVSGYVCLCLSVSVRLSVCPSVCVCLSVCLPEVLLFHRILLLVLLLLLLGYWARIPGWLLEALGGLDFTAREPPRDFPYERFPPASPGDLPTTKPRRPRAPSDREQQATVTSPQQGDYKAMG